MSMVPLYADITIVSNDTVPIICYIIDAISVDCHFIIRNILSRQYASHLADLLDFCDETCYVSFYTSIEYNLCVYKFKYL